MSIWHTQPTLEQLNEMGRDTMIAHLGIEVVEIGDDFLRAQMPVNERTLQPHGLMHGGASAALAETLGSMGGTFCVDVTKKFVVGLELNCNHVRSARSGHVHGLARPLHIGGGTHVWDIRITDDAGKLVCASRLTLVVLNRRD